MIMNNPKGRKELFEVIANCGRPLDARPLSDETDTISTRQRPRHEISKFVLETETMSQNLTFLLLMSSRLVRSQYS